MSKDLPAEAQIVADAYVRAKDERMKVDEKLPTLREIKRIPEFQPLRPKQMRFISALFHSNLIVTEAAKKSAIPWRNHYYWLKHDEQYRDAVGKAREMLGDLLESTMLDHAIAGREVPIVYQGQKTGTLREINPQERIALLRGLKPEYRDNFNLNQFNGPIQLNVNLGSKIVDPLTLSQAAALDEGRRIKERQGEDVVNPLSIDPEKQ